MSATPQCELTSPSPLLDRHGNLNQIGWARQPILDCNLEDACFYRLRALQRFRVKRWDYYGLTTPGRFFSMTLADLGYAGQVFAYTVGLGNADYHEETLTIPFGRGIFLPRNSTEGISAFEDHRVRMAFEVLPDGRRLRLDWPGFEGGKGLSAQCELALPPEHESLVIVIPIAGKRFYYNRKVNCMPAQGWLQYGGERYDLRPKESLGNLDWGRGVWAYQSYWVWASASGFLADGRTVGLKLGYGFGDTSAATENAVILGGRIHKLGQVDFAFTPGDYLRPWRMTSPDGRLTLELVPFRERLARTNLALITSEVHQMFGQYRGTLQTDVGEVIRLEGLTGFAEEHHARW